MLIMTEILWHYHDGITDYWVLYIIGGKVDSSAVPTSRGGIFRRANYVTETTSIDGSEHWTRTLCSSH